MKGRTVGVLVEGRSKNSNEELAGRTTCNRVVNFPGDSSFIGDIVRVKITEGYSNSLKGVVAGAGIEHERGTGRGAGGNPCL
jgi:tRNA-2-methylthio-N6-dimethylallyladenosine synthase